MIIISFIKRLTIIIFLLFILTLGVSKSGNEDIPVILDFQNNLNKISSTVNKGISNNDNSEGNLSAALERQLSLLRQQTVSQALISKGQTRNHLNKLGRDYEYMNQVRIKSSMIPFRKNSKLEESAQNHADYLEINNLLIHEERRGDRGFTGEFANDRANYANYRSRYIGEGISSESNSNLAIDGLMSAIYHRFGILSFYHDEVGIGLSDLFVHNTGNSYIDLLCKKEGTIKKYYYYNICDSDIDIDKTAFEQGENNVASRNPKIVVWPPDNETNISTYFHREDPDPLPNYSVSGYPVSIQFNPYYINDVKVISFKLYDYELDKEVTPVKLIDYNNDSNNLFTKNEFALFPLKRLKWNTLYKSEVVYTVDNMEELIVWKFRTKDLNLPLYEYSYDGEVFNIEPGIKYAFYIPPTLNYPKIGKIHWAYPDGMKLVVEFEDVNTVILKATGSMGQEATLTCGGSKTFKVKIS